MNFTGKKLVRVGFFYLVEGELVRQLPTASSYVSADENYLELDSKLVSYEEALSDFSNETILSTVEEIAVVTSLALTGLSVSYVEPIISYANSSIELIGFGLSNGYVHSTEALDPIYIDGLEAEFTQYGKYSYLNRYGIYLPPAKDKVCILISYPIKRVVEKPLTYDLVKERKYDGTLSLYGNDRFYFLDVKTFTNEYIDSFSIQPYIDEKPLDYTSDLGVVLFSNFILVYDTTLHTYFKKFFTSGQYTSLSGEAVKDPTGVAYGYMSKPMDCNLDDLFPYPLEKYILLPNYVSPTNDPRPSQKLDLSGKAYAVKFPSIKVTIPDAVTDYTQSVYCLTLETNGTETDKILPPARKYITEWPQDMWYIPMFCVTGDIVSVIHAVVPIKSFGTDSQGLSHDPAKCFSGETTVYTYKINTSTDKLDFIATLELSESFASGAYDVYSSETWYSYSWDFWLGAVESILTPGVYRDTQTTFELTMTVPFYGTPIFDTKHIELVIDTAGAITKTVLSTDPVRKEYALNIRNAHLQPAPVSNDGRPMLCVRTQVVNGLTFELASDNLYRSKVSVYKENTILSTEQVTGYYCFLPLFSNLGLRCHAYGSTSAYFEFVVLEDLQGLLQALLVTDTNVGNRRNLWPRFKEGNEVSFSVGDYEGVTGAMDMKVKIGNVKLDSSSTRKYTYYSR